MQPAVLVGDAGRDGRALDEDLAVLDPQVGGQQRRPAEPSLRRASPGESVVTCEAASVRP